MIQLTIDLLANVIFQNLLDALCGESWWLVLSLTLSYVIPYCEGRAR
ncbi:hypothetical protein VAT7223_01655 [Vibrio atlanticus]|uniref:Uncharacterized protein n=1 Tax=Vibrio atlanticus TaxID=693153 RepID=A0A1C3IPS5_9VIBR|nr:hypothetical protein VAT7223_01655 [Vibrio atlanticus]